jgi:cob(I)alamin adenosyltransferase
MCLQSGGLASCQLHISRTVCRRAERKVSDLLLAGDVEEQVGQYLNRLSGLITIHNLSTCSSSIIIMITIRMMILTTH